MILEIAIIIIYTTSLIFIFAYSLTQLNLLFNYLRAQRSKDDAPKWDFSDSKQIPYITIQLPVYNELYVMERLLDNIALLEYPKDKLEIQVLDDSTDESLQTTKAHVERLQKTGLDITQITRVDRSGFKAGALKEGLKIAKGEFIAIFDADFLPEPNWLKNTVPYFIDKAEIQNNDLLRCKIEGLDDQASAKNLVGKSLFLLMENLPALNADQFYFHEITL